MEDAWDIGTLRGWGFDLKNELRLYTPQKWELSLRDWYHGKSVFLVCGGPSLGDLDLSQLRRPGVCTFGVNNVWTVFRPNLWCCIDQPGNFIDTGWKDPAIIKFCPLGLWHLPLHVRTPTGFRESRYSVRDMPSVFMFPRNEKFNAPSFFSERTVNWGCHKKCPDNWGDSGARSVMLAALRLTTYLGFKKVYIVGADFGMKKSPAKEPAQNYAWKQWRHDSSVKNNNRTYEVLNRRFGGLKPGLKQLGVEVFNCTPGGGLHAFDRMEFQKAVDQTAQECEKKVNTEGWYCQQFYK
jgi:hypothetical protein